MSMEIEREVYRFVLTASTNSFAENVSAKYNGVRMVSCDGDVVEFLNRVHRVFVEQISAGSLRITIDVVNEDKVDFNDIQSIRNRIDCLIDEEYEPELMVDVITKSTNTPISWTLQKGQCMQAKAMMKMDMEPGVEEAVSFITSSAVGFSDEFKASLVKELNTGDYPHVINFITALAEM